MLKGLVGDDSQANQRIIEAFRTSRRASATEMREAWQCWKCSHGVAPSRTSPNSSSRSVGALHRDICAQSRTRAATGTPKD